MYITYKLFKLCRDKDNYADETLIEDGYITGETEPEIYKQMIDMCMLNHGYNLDGKFGQLDKIHISNILDFSYASSYDNDYVLQFGEIVLGSKPIDRQALDEMDGGKIHTLFRSYVNNNLESIKRIEDLVKENRLKLYEELKKEFGN